MKLGISGANVGPNFELCKCLLKKFKKKLKKLKIVV